MAIPKFRLTLTAPQIHYIHQLIQNDTIKGTEKLRLELDRYLKVFIVRMEVGSISEAFSATQKLSIEEKLGLEDDKESCYLRYQSNPKLCSPHEIVKAKTYMWENDMMTASEEEAFEKEMGL